MQLRFLLLGLSLILTSGSFAQSAYKLDKEAKKTLKTLQKEGWKTMEEGGDLEQQFTALHQLENEASDAYIFAYSEWESNNLQVAERRAWDGACSQIRNSEQVKVSGVVSVDESVTTRANGVQETQSDVIVSQRMSNKYVTTNSDLKKIFSIYRKTENGYKVQMVVAKEIK